MNRRDFQDIANIIQRVRSDVQYQSQKRLMDSLLSSIYVAFDHRNAGGFRDAGISSGDFIEMCGGWYGGNPGDDAQPAEPTPTPVAPVRRRPVSIVEAAQYYGWGAAPPPVAPTPVRPAEVTPMPPSMRDMTASQLYEDMVAGRRRMAADFETAPPDAGRRYAIERARALDTMRQIMTEPSPPTATVSEVVEQESLAAAEYVPEEDEAE